MIIKQLTTIEELEDVQGLERTVWGMEPLPIHQTFTAVKNGGMMLAAYENKRIVGFQYSFPGFQDGHTYLCSHMLGVHPDVQKRSIGVQLKRKQREIALEMGYSTIVWTFDPLLSLNAYLNLRKLRAVASTYFENYYGDMEDSLNAGLPSDRFKVEWAITSDHVSASEHSAKVFQSGQHPVLLNTERNKNGLPVCKGKSTQELSTHNGWMVPIPEDFQAIKSTDPGLAMDWRMKTRAVFQRLIEEGFVGVDLIRTDQNISYYVFVQRNTLNLKGTR